MKAMILCAGRGERLRPLTDDTPKPLITVQGEPLIVHQLHWLADAGVREVVINLHHLGEQIASALGDGSRWRVKISYSVEETLLETGGGIAQALPLLGTDPFVLLNGDIWTDYSFATLPEHLQAGVLAHLVLTPRPEHLDSGDFDLVDGRVTRGDARPYTYCGIAVIDPRLLAGRPAGRFSLREPLFDAIARGQVTGERFSGRWTDIGTPEQLRALQQNTPDGHRAQQKPYNKPS